MTTDFVILSAQKPPYGDPCNGCGMCCQEEACHLSVVYLGSSVAPCIALEWDGERYRCGLVLHSSKYLETPEFGDEVIAPLLSELLGVGKGCCAETTELDRKRRMEMQR